ncbi:MAG: hypothetical protein ACOX0V_10785 [Bacteroidales bacterium]|jgi:hypothetical protein|nr:hypothetical protein [Bacteroidales bacterium]NLP20818.1 hypothetical protein [Bacteroidales bacterium]OQC45194.1 MAG: hypothetical protein BWX59_01406 [Bacteroidetes bacterium ADurb.Bin028]HNY44036.1 hypothetical protein [Bacteroidales bacterium]HOD88387.1 hypothetical protein [Bacteroidales bacterium]
MKPQFYKILILTIFGILISYCSYSQFNYKDTLETKDGIEISYKIVNAKCNDKNSPAQIHLRLKNTNDYPTNIKFEIEYSTGFTQRYKSELIETCIPPKSTKAGRASGLVFELKTNDVDIFKNEDSEWEFTIFEVEKVENCRKLK